MSARTTILIVDDDASDVKFLVQVFERILANAAVRHVNTGRDAIDYVRGNGAYAKRDQFPVPALILLDLTLSAPDGFAVITQLKSDPATKVIPLVVYSAIDDPADIRRAYELGANAVMRKRLSFDAAVTAMKSTTRYWLEECGRAP